MAREIKFRVWSESDKEYRTGRRLVELLVKLSTSVTGIPATVYNDEGDEFIIEQYTGLKDKNDVEIYEGDIITAGYSMGHLDGEPAVVRWDEGMAKWEVYIPKEKETASLGMCFGIEVVGNIHENPELLEKKDDN